MTWQSLRNPGGQVFCSTSLNQCHSHHITRRHMLSPGLVSVVVLGHLAEVLVRFLHWEVPPHYTFSRCSLEGTHPAQPTLKGWALLHLYLLKLPSPCVKCSIAPQTRGYVWDSAAVFWTSSYPNIGQSRTTRTMVHLIFSFKWTHFHKRKLGITTLRRPWQQPGTEQGPEQPQTASGRSSPGPSYELFPSSVSPPPQGSWGTRGPLGPAPKGSWVLHLSFLWQRAALLDSRVPSREGKGLSRQAALGQL